MAHNVSPSRRASVAMRERLADLAGWHLQVECGTNGCKRGRRHDLRQVERCWPRLTLSQAIGRMRCRECRKAPVAAVLWPWDDHLRRHGRVPVLGPGSY